MARPNSKKTLLDASSQYFERLQDSINALPDEMTNERWLPASGDWNVRDIIMHLYEWHQMLIMWVKENMAGNHQPFLPAPYSWKDLPAVNQEIWKKHCSTPFSEAMKLLRQSHEETMAVIRRFSDDELFTKKYFNWTGTTSLGAYCVSATSSHYDWANKQLKKLLKQYNAAY